MGFPILVRRHLYIESGPWSSLVPCRTPLLMRRDSHRPQGPLRRTSLLLILTNAEWNTTLGEAARNTMCVTWLRYWRLSKSQLTCCPLNPYKHHIFPKLKKNKIKNNNPPPPPPPQQKKQKIKHQQTNRMIRNKTHALELHSHLYPIVYICIRNSHKIILWDTVTNRD